MTNSAADLSREALAQLMHFYADAGVEWLVEDLPVDRFAETERLAAAKMGNRAALARDAAPTPGRLGGEGRAIGPAPERSALPLRADAPPPRPPLQPQQASRLTIPDEAAFADARALAAGASTIAALRAALDGFTGCNLRNSAKSLVFADGNPEAPVMVIGEAPGRDEDLQGLPFVGGAGQLLDRMLKAIGLDRSGVYITTMVPWRPPGNRTPAPHEIELCRPFIERHVALAQPKLLLLMGNVATKALLRTDKGILSIRGRFVDCTLNGQVIPALPTLDPAYLLRNPAQKRHSWADLQVLKDRLDAL